MRGILAFLLLFLVTNLISGQSIFSNTITGNNPNNNNPYTIGQVIDGNITVSGISRGTGINGQNGNDRYNARDWDLTTLDINDYFEFIITPNATFEIDFISFEYTGQRSNTGPINIAVRSSIDGFTSDIGMSTITGATIDLSAVNYQNISAAITFRVYAWGGSNTNGTFSINDFTFNGVVNAIPCPTSVTWSGGTWSNGTGPDLTIAAVIDDVYNTFTNGSFSACSLNVNTGNTLTITNGSYIEIENDITVDGNIIVSREGAVVQNNDVGLVNNNGSIRVDKRTAPMNNWYEYTYWSSPVSNETIGTGLSESQVDRRFSFNGANFLDATMETNNNNTTVAGQDDIDDNGDDWTSVNAFTVMTPGVGYATTHDQFIFSSTPGGLPKQLTYIFEGSFNNGIISVPVYRNDSETNDNNWNLIGNPYPSAIDADLFLAANSNIATNVVVDGAIFLWSQNTPPSNTTNGNEAFNFVVSDYAIINAVGEVAGGDNVIPNRFIPSGQGFFVVYSDAATPDSTVGNISEGTVIFNNSMRVTGDNTQFFRTNHKNKDKNNKLWLNLTSDNGVFNQILIAYATGATDAYDGMAYDTQKNLSSGTSAILYSNIEGSNKKFAIQGKAPSNLTDDEIISIGYKTSIEIPTIYTLSIAQLEGDFLINNTIYLKDNLLYKIHNLKDSDYNFTSEVGEFNNRFEIIFSQDALSVNNTIANENALSIIEHKNGDVQFKLNAPNKISNIKIIDLQGRVLYDYEVDSKDEVLKLSNLSRAPYIAKVTLDNNFVITKKAIKKY